MPVAENDAENSMRRAHAGRPEVTDSLELKGGMTRIGFQELIVGASQSLQFRRELVKTPPEQS
jgi:hypothetical protein